MNAYFTSNIALFPTQSKMNKTEITTIAKEALKSSQKKKVTLVQEPITLADGSAFTPISVKNSSDLLRASLLTLFKHVADIHVTVVEVIAEKFDLDVDEIHKAITEDPRWEKMLVDPLITDLTETAEKQAKPKKKPVKISEEEELIFD